MSTELEQLSARLDPIGTRHRLHNIPSTCMMSIRKRGERGTACSNGVSFCLARSDGTNVFCCGIKRHQRQAIQACTDGVTGRLMVRLSNDRFEVISVDLQQDSDPELPINWPDANDNRERLLHFVNAERLIRDETTNLRSLYNDITAQIGTMETIRRTYRASLRRAEHQAKLLRGAKNVLLQRVPFELEWRDTYNGDMMCAICHEKMERDRNAGMLRECSHAFHVKCITRWFALVETCPCCRTHCDTDAYRGVPSESRRDGAAPSLV